MMARKGFWGVLSLAKIGTRGIEIGRQALRDREWLKAAAVLCPASLSSSAEQRTHIGFPSCC
jgi:hypothetical protein